MTRAFFVRTAMPMNPEDDYSHPDHTWWHGTPTGKMVGGDWGLHVGTQKAARDALGEKIGYRADGKDWDGTQEYGSTMLMGRDNLQALGRRVYGHNSLAQQVPNEDHMPRPGYAAFGANNKNLVPMEAKPDLFPVKIKGPMDGSVYSDEDANDNMTDDLEMGSAHQGYFYENKWEDPGSVSAALPHHSFLQRLPRGIPSTTAFFVRTAAQPITLYHGTSENGLAHVTQNGLSAPSGVNSAGWPMLTDDFNQAARYSRGKVVEYQFHPDELDYSHPKGLLWPAQSHTAYGYGANAYGVKNAVPADHITQVHDVTPEQQMANAPKTSSIPEKVEVESEHDGGMIALIPSNLDELHVDGGDDKENLHLTLLILGDEWDEERKRNLLEYIDLAKPGKVNGRAFAHADFNPDTEDGCAVYLVSGISDEIIDLRDELHENLDPIPEQHSPWIPHITAGFGLESSALSFIGDVIFSKLRVVWAGETYDFDLGENDG